jgi:hypothetical protein
MSHARPEDLLGEVPMLTHAQVEAFMASIAEVVAPEEGTVATTHARPEELLGEVPMLTQAQVEAFMESIAEVVAPAAECAAVAAPQERTAEDLIELLAAGVDIDAPNSALRAKLRRGLDARKKAADPVAPAEPTEAPVAPAEPVEHEPVERAPEPKAPKAKAPKAPKAPKAANAKKTAPTKAARKKGK